MERSEVYFTDMRCKGGESLLTKLDKLITKAGIQNIDFKNRFAAIKLHFGEPGNLSYLRPNFAKTVADKIKSLGGLPFLTDCGTLYVGRRNNAVAHLDAASENGFSPLTTGCHVIIGDGIKGTDDVEVPVNGEYFKTALIGRAIMDADIFISLNHFKGHELAGFGGAIKNIGMGSGSRAGKMLMHSSGKPEIDPELCVGCRVCSKHCNQGAISYGENGKARIDLEKCVGCGRCIGVCAFDAIAAGDFNSNKDLNCKMAEYTLAVLNGRPHFHISIVNQVSPFCDCHAGNDAAIIPDIGMFASFDPVALDKACIDAAKAAPALESSILSEREKTGDHFTNIHPATDWRDQISHAEKIGLGSSDYELITF